MSAILIKKIPEWADGLTVNDYVSNYQVARKTRYILAKDFILLNHVKASGDTMLHENDELSIDFTSMLREHPRVINDTEIKIIYEDDDLIVVEKPHDLLVYDDGNQKDNLTGRVAYYFEKKEYPFPVFPIHRLDEQTSGMILFAKHPLALSYMSHLFESKNIEKVYECVVAGKLDKKKMTITSSIVQDRHQAKMRVDIKGDDAVTHLEVIEENNHTSRLNVMIESGKKHQIRVHLSDMRHAIIGDDLYQGRHHDRLLLHFKKVTFIHPETHQEMTISSPVPF
jgi:23S rRNA pseudouridine1911/1915/1917 synthase